LDVFISAMGFSLRWDMTVGPVGNGAELHSLSLF